MNEKTNSTVINYIMLALKWVRCGSLATDQLSIKRFGFLTDSGLIAYYGLGSKA